MKKESSQKKFDVTDRLLESFQDTIDYYTREYNLKYKDIFWALELVKKEMMEEFFVKLNRDE